MSGVGLSSERRHMNHRSPVAIVDVGSASMQLVIAEMKDGRIHILHREKKLARLAEGRTASGSLKANFKETLVHAR